MRNLDNFHHYRRILDAVDDAVDALPSAVKIVTGKFFRTGRTRFTAQFIDSGNNAFDICLGDAAQVFVHRCQISLVFAQCFTNRIILVRQEFWGLLFWRTMRCASSCWRPLLFMSIPRTA